ncbi:MAG: flavodoxin-dependent (E)-4-hydroxy-3-methylbut-2-enyl-diphosphate synthase [Candidatus Methylomirabilia bacterium]
MKLRVDTEPCRKRTRAVRVGALTLGGGAPVRIQSMTKTDTNDVGATVRQVRALERAGCEIVRLAVPGHDAVASFAKIRARVSLPLVADIHFDHRLAIACIEAGADKVRLNPGNIGGTKRLQEVARRAKERGCAIRVGVNSGSLEKDLQAKHGGATPAALVESAVRAVRDLEEVGFRAIVVSLKASSVLLTIAAYRLAARALRYPLHLGVTEAGWGLAGIVKSSVGMGALLADGIGDTLRVSLTDTPVEEVRVAREILSAVGLRRAGVEIISCPTCGRCGVDLQKTARAVQRGLADIATPLTVAVMGCPVNGPGEAKSADVGLAGGRGKAVIFSGGKILKTVPESSMIGALVEAVREEAGRREQAKGRG